MDRERWQKVKQIIEDAVELPTGERQDFVAAKCGDDPEIQAEVVSLLAEAEASDALESNAVEHVAPPEDKLLNTQIGNYRLTELIGTGGMGRVYLAERADGVFEQKVALKLIRRGLDSDEILRRFVTERQILASLEHPNIAHLIDGGTTPDGLPFLVMEYVEGTPIVAFADANGLDLNARLDLFREVCAAVSFAHQKLVIHRDLKPANILITHGGKAKLLDFGIAKLVKTDGEETRTQTFAFTPDYASPEQIRGENLSTATDVYSLGVILYELLTGSRPFKFDDKNIGEIVATATNTVPLAPSSTAQRSKIKDQRSLKGDLDTIVLKALKKEPERRYSSVGQFADDIQRYLKGQPVLARNDTWAYRASKFARRSPFLVGASAVAVIALVSGTITTAYQARQANIAREKAEARFNDVRALANSFMFEINEEIMRSPVKARELLVARALEYLDKLALESAGNIELKAELASAYEKIGEVQSELFRPFAGKTSEAALSQQKALKLRQEINTEQPTAEHAMSVAVSHQKVGNVLLTSGKIGEARDNYSRSVDLLKSLVAADKTNTETRRQLARSLATLGQSIVRSGSLSDALGNYEASLSIFRELATEDPTNNRAKRSVGIVISYIGFVKKEMGRMEEALADYEQWLAIEKDLVTRDSNNIDFRHDLSSAHTWNGVLLAEMGNISEAQQNFREAINIQTAIMAADKESVGVAYSLADCHLEFGKAMARRNISDTAIEHLTLALDSYRTIWNKDKENQLMRHRIANAQRFIGDAYFQKNDLSRAAENYEQAHAAFVELTAFDPLNLDWQQDLAMTYTRRGELALKKANKPEAKTNFSSALPIFEKLTQASPDNINRRSELEHLVQQLKLVS
ncbi:MAG TPA: serine/threonine-protein kinase [Pyrinomonadaceae bacterium]|nr:serine/threonine-protein kinase [Pyrinomonadaceae bacterium]